MKRKIKTIIKTAIILISVFAAVLLYDFIGFGKSEVLVNIPSGGNGSEITQILKDNGVILFETPFKVFSRMHASDFKAGVHKMKKNMGYLRAVSELKENGAAVNGVMVTIPEGFEMREIASLLEKKGICTADDFKRAAKKRYNYDFLKTIPARENYLEGYLFPDTYEFLPASSPETVINKMLSRFESMLSEEYLKRIDEMGMALHEAVTLASIIEREAALDSERAIVSSVFHNRLNSEQYPYLQSCATVQYILKERKKVLSNADTKIDSPYNTYINKGLPPGPIASPGEASFRAAIYPDKTDYYFFVVDNKGGHHFSKTFEEHLRAQGE